MTPDKSPPPSASEPPVDPRKPPDNDHPKSHSTGGAKDHTAPHERPAGR